MNNQIFIFLIMHLLGDYYFQNDKLNKNKKASLKFTFFHLIEYSIPFLFVLFFSVKFWALILFCIMFHAVVDLMFFQINKKVKEEYFRVSYSIDQILHVLGITFAIFYFKINVDIPIKEEIVKYVLYFLIIFKPISISFSIFFPSLNDKNDNSKNFGATIGYLERCLIALCLIMDKYNAIGFVIAAKAFARSSTLKQDSEKCEYFLVGSLFSYLSAIVFYIILFKIFV